MSTTLRPIVAAIAAVALAATAGTVAAQSPQRQAGEQINRGYKAAKRGYWQEALFRFERANALVPNDPRVLNNIAVALEASGRFDEALVAYETALAVAPNDRVLRQNYSRFKEFYDTQIAEPKPEEAEDASAGGEAAPEEESDDA